jgi:steroid delta-isomerase-like uncharacterized protein
MSTEENKTVVRRWFEDVLSQGNVQLVDTICMQCTPSFVVIQGVANPPPQGLEGVKELVAGFRTAFPDMKFIIEDQIAEGNQVATRLTVRGTHLGEFMGIPASGKPVSVSAVSIWRVAEGKLVNEWVNWDSLGMMQQIGVIPTSSQA